METSHLDNLTPWAGYQEQPQPCLTCNKVKVSSAYLLSNMAWGDSAQKTENKQE